MYRLYDNIKKKWVDNVYITPTGNIFIEKKTWYGLNKLVIVDEKDRYTIHRETGMYDKFDDMIYEGDICKLEFEDKTITGLVVYYDQHASFYLINYDNDTFYPMRDEYYKDHIEVIGAIMENKDLLGENANYQSVIKIQ